MKVKHLKGWRAILKKQVWYITSIFFNDKKHQSMCIPFGDPASKMSLPLHQTHSEEDDSFSEEEMEEDAGRTVEQRVHETELGVTELELQFRQDEFAEVDRGDDPVKEKLKDKKVAANNSYAIEMFFVFLLHGWHVSELVSSDHISFVSVD